MPERDARCVFVAADEGSADMIAGILTAGGFPAQVANRGTGWAFAGVPGVGDSGTDSGFEVWVVDAAHVDAAKKLLAEEVESADAARRKREELTGTVSAVCEECGKSSDWPANLMGTTQDCPHCQSFLDVPDPDENWDGVDFTAGAEPELPPDEGD